MGIHRKNYPGEPAWLREAKFGIWVHFGPQAAGESGDMHENCMWGVVGFLCVLSQVNEVAFRNEPPGVTYGADRVQFFAILLQ